MEMFKTAKSRFERFARWMACGCAAQAKHEAGVWQVRHVLEPHMTRLLIRSRVMCGWTVSLPCAIPASCLARPGSGCHVHL